MHLLLKHLRGIVWKTERYSSFNNIFFWAKFQCNPLKWLTNQSPNHHLPYRPCQWCVPPPSRWERGKVFSASTFFEWAADRGSDSKTKPSSCGETVAAQGCTPTPGGEENEIDRNKKVFPVLLLSWKSNMEILQRVKQHPKNTNKTILNNTLWIQLY